MFFRLASGFRGVGNRYFGKYQKRNAEIREIQH